MPYFRKKPITVEAVQFTGRNQREVLAFIYPDMSEDGLHGAEVMNLPIVIGTAEGNMIADPGDWVIREPFPTGDRTHYPCKPDIFAATYEPVSDAQAGDAP